MKLRLILGLIMTVCAGVGLSSWLVASSAEAGGPSSIATGAVVMSATAADAEAGYKYVGSKACKKCHLTQYKSWAKTKMGQAFETLKPGHAAEIKKELDLDPAKDYTKDPKCLQCHTVGFGAPGGYVIPDEEHLVLAAGADVAKELKKAVKAAKNREGVGCESCHGPGEEYVKVFKEIMKSKRTYKVAELQAVGLREVNEAGCKTCHNDKGPKFDPSKAFNFEEDKEKDTHKHKPLKLRAG